jgi:hypothetical protein
VGGVWNGVRREWHENGRLALEENCELGVALSRKTWDEQGMIMEDFALQPTDPNFKYLHLLRKHDVKHRWTAR